MTIPGSDEAAIAALAWRGGWISIGDVDSRDDWRRLSRFSPLGWLLWSRLDDADERAIARCIELLSVDPAFADAIADDGVGVSSTFALLTAMGQLGKARAEAWLHLGLRVAG